MTSAILIYSVQICETRKKFHFPQPSFGFSFYYGLSLLLDIPFHLDFLCTPALRDTA